MTLPLRMRIIGSAGLSLFGVTVGSHGSVEGLAPLRRGWRTASWTGAAMKLVEEGIYEGADGYPEVVNWLRKIICRGESKSVWMAWRCTIVYGANPKNKFKSYHPAANR